MYAQYLRNIYQKDYLSDDHKKLLLNKMKDTDFEDRISNDLEEDIIFYHKIGSWGETGSWHDCGIAEKGSNALVVCLMSQNTTYEEFLKISHELGKFINNIL